MDNILVSVIIPTYNRAQKLKRCLKSLTQQTFKEFEVIVCDDGSIDHTEEVVNGFLNELNLAYDYDSNRGGPAWPRNRGIKLAKGKYIAFLDSDDWWYPQKLQASIAYFPEFDLVYHNLEKYFQEDKVAGTLKARMLKGDSFKDLLINGNAIPNSSVILKKEIIDLVGDISEDINLIAVEDAEYWLRVAKVTNKFKYIPQSLGAYWMEGNISLSEKHIEREMYLVNMYTAGLSPFEKVRSNMVLKNRQARVYHKMGNFEQARQCYLQAINLPSASIKLKCLIGIIACAFKVIL